MSTLTRNHNHSNNPNYKGYINFLHNYKSADSAKKEVTISTTNIGNKKEVTTNTTNIGNEKEVTTSTTNIGNKKEVTTSTTNIGNEKEVTVSTTNNGSSKTELKKSLSSTSSGYSSDVVDHHQVTTTRTETASKVMSYNNFLETTKNKKYGPVKIPRAPKTSGAIKKKSEIFIEIQPQNNGSVSEVSKIFEKKVKVAPKTPTNSTANSQTIIKKKIAEIMNNGNNNKPQISEKPTFEPPATTGKIVVNVNLNGDANKSVPSPPPPPPPMMMSPPAAKPQVAKQSQYVVNSTDGKLDKNDPAVRKLVYGALRGMYGAQHDKANGIVATLPRTMVKKDNQINRIISEMASNGDLEKLNGRAIPKSED